MFKGALNASAPAHRKTEFSADHVSSLTSKQLGQRPQLLGHIRQLTFKLHLLQVSSAIAATVHSWHPLHPAQLLHFQPASQKEQRYDLQTSHDLQSLTVGQSEEEQSLQEDPPEEARAEVVEDPPDGGVQVVSE
jgi:hypothetical protein